MPWRPRHLREGSRQRVPEPELRHVRTTPPTVLTVAGSDSSGGAGAQADILTFQALGVLGATAITAVTSQSTLGVQRVDPLPAPAVEAQILSVVEDIDVSAVKTGMLANAEIADLIVSLAAGGRLPNLVVDPVLAASDGSPLATDDTLDVYLDLFKHAAVITPNASEAVRLVRPAEAVQPETGAALDHVAEQLHELSDGATVVVTGGDATGTGDCTDIVCDASGVIHLSAPRLRSRNTHGTGCTFSAAIAAHLAAGCGRREAVEQAKRYVSRAIASAAGWRVGSTSGHGPLDHLAGALPCGAGGLSEELQ